MSKPTSAKSLGLRRLAACVMAMTIISDVLSADAVEVVSESGVKKHEYIKSISGKADCKMPIDSEKPTADECALKKDFVETGKRIFRQGDVCVEEAVDFKYIKQHPNQVIATPVIGRTVKRVEC